MLKEQRHSLLFVPGLGETNARRSFFAQAITPLSRAGVEPRLVSANWVDGKGFEDKLDVLTDLVDKELRKNKRISLMGASAAGPLVIGALMERPKVHKVVTLSSRLKSTEHAGYASMRFIERLSSAAADGIRWLENHQEESLSDEQRKKILNTRVYSGDTQVHPSTSFISGAENVWLPPVRGHIEAVSKALTVHSEVIVDFLKR